MSEVNYKRIQCAQCAIEFVSVRMKKYCSTRCCGRAQEAKRSSPREPAKYRRSCLTCANEYTYHPAGKDAGREHKRGLFCSSACRMQHTAENAVPKFCFIKAAYCLKCGSPFVATRDRAFCGSPCKPVYRMPPQILEVKACKVCDLSFVPVSTGGRPGEYCGQQCRDVADAAHARVQKAQRKALLASVTVDRADPYKVFDRDRWRCQLCGIRTPKSQRGTYEDNAPELDHILPISKGGSHSYMNTQCACRKCNSAKSNRPLGQLLLFGY